MNLKKNNINSGSFTDKLVGIMIDIRTYIHIQGVTEYEQQS